jgi:alpha-tubulin suppressor-like RCC1 family protein
MGIIRRIFGMNMISRSKKRNYAQIVCIFFAVIALIVAIGGCGESEGEGGDDYYWLYITSTYGGSVITPEEGDLWCAANTTVELIAEPDAHHHFVSWTGDIDTIGNATAAATNITMYDSYSIVANFELDEGWYSLIILSNYGGSVVEPGEGYFAYAADTTVELVAEPLDYRQFDYRFEEWTGDVDTIANFNAAATNITMDNSYSITPNFEWFDIIQVAAGEYHTLGLKNEGTVVAVGYCGYDLCNVGNWTDIVQISAGSFHTMGLKADGTVLAVGLNDDGQCNVESWTDIIQVTAGLGHTVGLKADGTVVAVGSNEFGQCNVESWTDIIQVSAGSEHTVGLKSDGTVVAAGPSGGSWPDCGQCDVASWTGINQTATGTYHTVGLKSDGTVVAVGFCGEGECNVGNWNDIIQIAAAIEHTVGLKSDGTVVAAGWGGLYEERLNVGSWTDIIQVAAGQRHTVGLKNDGTVVVAGWGGYGECNV